MIEPVGFIVQKRGNML